MESKKFKKKFIGGFDKSEVIDYIDNLQKTQAEEMNEQKYLEQIERLTSERDALADALEKANEQLKKLSDPLIGSKSMLASSIAHSKSHFDNMVSLSDEVKSETNDNLEKISGDVREMIANAAEMKKNFENAADNLGSDLEKLQSFLEKSLPFFRDDRGKLGDISKKAVEKDNGAKEVLEEGFKLLDETTAQQSEIDKLLQEVKQ